MSDDREERDLTSGDVEDKPSRRSRRSKELVSSDELIPRETVKGDVVKERLVYRAFSKIIDNTAELIKLKTIITLILVIVFAYLTMKNIEVDPAFSAIVSSVLTYYFTKREGKEEK